MAVHDQYPSHLHLNRNTEVKNNDCSLQLQSHTFVDDYSRHQILFTDFPVGSGGGDLRKTREIDMNKSMSFLHQHQFYNQNIDVSTGLRLSFHDQQKLQHNSLSSQCSVLSFLSDELSTQIDQQRHEIEQFLHTQGEELQRMLANKRQMHYCALLRAAEDTISRQMKDKEVETEKAKRRNAELEARAARVSAEARVWETRVRAQEAEAATLQSQLQEAIVSRGVGDNCLLEREEVGCTFGSGDPEDAESAYIDPERVVLASGPGCKACGKRVASVVLLPCRHLCVCTECDGVVSACPLCLSFRSSSIEVYMS